MRLRVDFSELERLANMLNTQQPQFELQRSTLQFQPIDIDLGNEGIEINIKDVDIKSGLLSVKGRQVLLYIKDHSYSDTFSRALKNGQDGNKFHVASCQVLTRMMSQGRYQRYVATNRIKGDFLIQDSKGNKGHAHLWVCQACLRHLNYKGSREKKNTYNNAKNFNLKEFFSTYSSMFDYMPTYSSDDNVNYSDDWQAISKKMREAASYQCEKCTVNLQSHPHLCHVHHINGVKQDNSSQNLQVLCADCHRKEHLGHMHVPKKDMQTITALRRQQQLSTVNNWLKALHFIDPALRGELELFQNDGYEAPSIGYEIINERSKQALVVCEAAWPMRREALVLHAENKIPGWKIYSFGERFGSS
ncbi:HNH endonuclease signature motif containing protein [Paenalcaligenes hominis]|uniref:HNH endonuclease signature motif containing protein n=1 Tax=Paenalcaligenes hominis TaxID=643674 RepID=UPI003524B32D